MYLLKKVTLSIVLLCLIISPITHAYDLSSAWHKPEHRVWVIRGAALCAVFLAMLAYYSLSKKSSKFAFALNAMEKEVDQEQRGGKGLPSDKQLDSKPTSVEDEDLMQNSARRRKLMILGHLHGSYASMFNQRMKYLDGMSGGIEDEEEGDDEAWEGTLKCKKVENEIARLELGQLISRL